MGGEGDVGGERKMLISNEDLDKYNVPISYRDYCAHHFVKWQECLRSNIGI